MEFNKKNWIRLSSAVLVALIFSAGSGPLVSAQPLETGSVSLPSPEIDKSVKSVAEYKIQPEDVLAITVYEEPDLTTKVRVTGAGEINFPLLGKIEVSEMTVTQLQQHLTQLLEADYLVNPQVQVFIEIYHARNVIVAGAVLKPGTYPIPTEKPTTLMEALAMAGGFSKGAAINKTRIVRIENGQEQIIYVKAEDIVNKGDKTKDIEVKPNDVIFVPESFF